MMLQLLSKHALEIAAIIGALVTIATFANLLNRKISRWTKAAEVVFDISEQFRPNHGTSLRDVIDRIDGRTVVLQAVQRAVLQVQEYAITETDGKGNLTWANKVYLHMTGMAIADVRGRGWVQAIHEEDRERIVRDWQYAVEDQRDAELEFCLLTANGTPQPVHAKCFALRDHEERVHGWIALLHKIECRDRTELRCQTCKFYR